MSLAEQFFPSPDGFPRLPSYSAKWRAIRFELSPGTGEWVTSHIALVDVAGCIVIAVLRPAVLRSVFGSSAKNFESLLRMTQQSLEKFLGADGELSAWSPSIEGFAASQVKTVYARMGRTEALRMAARQSTVMCALDDLESPVEIESPDDEAKYWSSRIKEAVLERRPDLSQYFDRSGQLYADTARFGFLTGNAGAHFANLTPQNSAQNARMARGKLQELRTGMRTMQLTIAKLIAGAPRVDDITLTDRQVAASQRGIDELRQEAAESGVLVDIVHSPQEAADAVISLV